MFSIPFLSFRREALSDEQRRALLKFACAIAWADGTIADSERAELSRSLEELGGIHRSELEQMLASTKTLDEATKQELVGLPPADAHHVLKLAFAIANADGHIDDRELAVIQDACTALFPDKPWDLIHDWIRSHHAFLNATKRLFGPPQLRGDEPPKALTAGRS